MPGILETVLRMNGAAMVRENGVYKIGPVGNALRGASTPQMGNVQAGYGVQVVQLQYISAREMAKILEPLVPEGSILRVDESFAKSAAAAVKKAGYGRLGFEAQHMYYQAVRTMRRTRLKAQ